MAREYTAWFTTSVQISEDRYDVYHPHLKIDDNTTIGQIRDWYVKQVPATEKERETMRMGEIKISPLQ